VQGSGPPSRLQGLGSPTSPPCFSLRVTLASTSPPAQPHTSRGRQTPCTARPRFCPLSVRRGSPPPPVSAGLARFLAFPEVLGRADLSWAEVGPGRPTGMGGRRVRSPGSVQQLCTLGGSRGPTGGVQRGGTWGHVSPAGRGRRCCFLELLAERPSVLAACPVWEPLGIGDCGGPASLGLQLVAPRGQPDVGPLQTRALADGSPGQAVPASVELPPSWAGAQPPGLGHSGLWACRGSLRLNPLLLHCNALPLV